MSGKPDNWKAIAELPFASTSTGSFECKYCKKNRFCMRIRFETETQGDSEAISFPEPTCLLVSTKTRSSGIINNLVPRAHVSFAFKIRCCCSSTFVVYLWTPCKPRHACAVKLELLKSWSLGSDFSRAPCLGADQKTRGLRERDWLGNDLFYLAHASLLSMPCPLLKFIYFVSLIQYQRGSNDDASWSYSSLVL